MQRSEAARSRASAPDGLTDRHLTRRRPSPDACCGKPRQEGARPAEDFPRRGARRRQDLRDAAPRPGARGSKASMSSSASSRRMAARETEALLDGLEIVPRRASTTRATPWRRWISTRILARRPQLVLVDELAHTNAPGSRHPKRYWTWRNCSPPASMSIRRSISSMSRA